MITKHKLIALLLLLSSLTTVAQQTYPPRKDVTTLSGILSAAYESISGEVGTPRQLERIQSLYAPNGIVSKNSTTDGIYNREVLTINEFHQRFKPVREYNFFEEEINREVRIFGTIATVWSTYQIHKKKDGPVVNRGINSIQLHYKEDRWWILSWAWDVERDENKIPATFDSY